MAKNELTNKNICQSSAVVINRFSIKKDLIGRDKESE